MNLALLTTDNREPFREYHKPEPWFGAAPEALLQGFARMPDLDVHVVACTQQPVRSPEKLAANIWFHSLHVPKLGWLRTGYQGCIRAVRRKLNDLQPDIVHGQGTERDCALSAILAGFPNVVTIHGNMAELARLFRARPFTFDWLTARLEDFTLPRTAGVLCNSAYTADLVRSRARRVWRVANPLRELFLDAPPPGGLPARPVLLNVGVISPRKRQLELLGVARELHRRGLSFEWRFVGVLDERTEYGRLFKARLKEAEGAGYAAWLGTMDAAGLRRCMDDAGALVHFPTEEAFGLVVAEALARNLKLFAARTGGVTEIADGVEGAELFAPEDTASLTGALQAWIASSARVRPSHAAPMMAARYHPDLIARRHLEIYREVLSTSA